MKCFKITAINLCIQKQIRLLPEGTHMFCLAGKGQRKEENKSFAISTFNNFDEQVTESKRVTKFHPTAGITESFTRLIASSVFVSCGLGRGWQMD